MTAAWCHLLSRCVFNTAHILAGVLPPSAHVFLCASFADVFD